MNLATTVTLRFGGQGSGCHGPNCGRPKGNASPLEIAKSLNSVSTTGKLPRFVVEGIVRLTNMGIDKRFFDSRKITSFRVAGQLSINPLAIGNYNETHRKLEFRDDANASVVVHEIAHHIDIAFTRQPGSELNLAKCRAVQNAYTDEYKAARGSMSEALGHKFNYDKDLPKLEKDPGLWRSRNAITPYAVSSSKEWWAESVMMYARNEVSRERLERIAPRTYKAIQTVFSGGIFK
jgi:hypothetical protein